jgi:hypothetical protein
MLAFAMVSAILPESSQGGDVGAFQLCIPNPDLSNPDGQDCWDIPVLIEPPKLLDDPKIAVEVLPEEIRGDIAVLVGIDRLAERVQDEGLRAHLVEVVDAMANQFADKLPSGITLTRAG